MDENVLGWKEDGRRMDKIKKDEEGWRKMDKMDENGEGWRSTVARGVYGGVGCGGGEGYICKVCIYPSIESIVKCRTKFAISSTSQSSHLRIQYQG